MSHLTHLRTFLEVYRVRSISQAAVNLGITQPTASLHIQAIEMFVGKPLFIRQPRGLHQQLQLMSWLVLSRRILIALR